MGDKLRIQRRLPGNGMNGLGRYGNIYGLPRNGCNNGGDHQNRNGCNGIAGKNR